MATLFPIGSMVTVTGKSPVPVAGHAGDHTGRKGKVRGYTDLSPKSGDIIHVVDLGHLVDKIWLWYDEPLYVPNETPNPSEYGPQGPTGRKIHGESLPAQRVDWLEVPASCLS
jgi:hypothetical protein